MPTPVPLKAVAQVPPSGPAAGFSDWRNPCERGSSRSARLPRWFDPLNRRPPEFCLVCRKTDWRLRRRIVAKTRCDAGLPRSSRWLAYDQRRPQPRFLRIELDVTWSVRRRGCLSTARPDAGSFKVPSRSRGSSWSWIVSPRVRPPQPSTNH
jgi:hypothetical protein